MPLTNLEVTLILIYAIPSITLYIFILILILRSIRKEPFSSHFYKFFVINGFFDLIRWITVYLEIRVSLASWYFWFYEMMPKSGPLLTVLVWLLYYSFYGQITTYFFITLNRFTAIIFIFNHKQVKNGIYPRRFWKRVFPISVFIIFFIQIPFTWHLISNGGRISQYNISDPTSGYGFDASIPGLCELRNSLYQSIFCCVAAVSGLFMNLSIVISLWKHRHSNVNLQETSIRDSEIKLFIFAVILFVILVCEMVVQVDFHTRLADMSKDEFYLVYEFHAYFTDFLCLSPPWILLILSKATRDEFLKVVNCRNPFIGSNSAITPIIVIRKS